MLYGVTTLAAAFAPNLTAPLLLRLLAGGQRQPRQQGRPAAVLPIAMDTAGTAGVVAFYAKYGLTHLPVYADPDQK